MSQRQRLSRGVRRGGDGMSGERVGGEGFTGVWAPASAGVTGVTGVTGERMGLIIGGNLPGGRLDTGCC